MPSGFCIQLLNGAKNAGIRRQIIALNNEEVALKLSDFKSKLEKFIDSEKKLN